MPFLPQNGSFDFKMRRSFASSTILMNKTLKINEDDDNQDENLEQSFAEQLPPLASTST